jgi:predicted TIM-barrel fold metal-dependent hydrolase
MSSAAIDFHMISVDDHIDLPYLPGDLWTTRLPVEFRERGPRVVLDDDGIGTWACGDASWGRWAGGRRDNIKRSYKTALERAGLDNEGELRPTIAELRLVDMDSDNIEATVMYGPVAALDIDDPELRRAVYAAYNDWLIEFCSGDPKRLIGVAMLPAEDALGSTAELRRLAERGETKQVSMHIARVEAPIYGPEWTEFWDVIDESGIIASFHLVLSKAMMTGLDDRAARIYNASKEFILQFLDPLVGMVGEGVLDARPNAKLVLAESGLGWPPWVMQEMDYRYSRLVSMSDYWSTRGGIEISRPPSEIFRDQVWVTFQDDRLGLDILDWFGPDKVMWACDYPHPDSTFPESLEVVERLTAHLPSDVRQRLLRDNAAALYGL